MANLNIPEEVINEVENLININEPKTEEIEALIIYDKRQYSLKIPKKIAEKAGINHETDKFVFEIKTYPIEESKKPELIITLKRGEN
jgi:exoribonuclease R